MRTLGVAFLLMLLACAQEEAPPADVLPRERFKELLLQAQLIEARVNHELIVEHRSRVPTERYYADLFAEQGVTEEQFTASYRHYLGRPEELKAIYEEIITELTFRKDSDGAVQPGEPAESER